MPSLPPSPDATVAEGDGDDADVASSEDEPSAAELLERGFAFFQGNRYAEARDSFKAALATENLNDAGRVVAYWHIFLAERDRGDLDAAAEALTSFLVVGQDVLDVRPTMRFAVDESGDFVDRFDLTRRLARARATLSAIWAGKVPEYGRSLDRPVVIDSDNEMNYFLEVAPPCADADDRQVWRMPAIQVGGVKTERVNVRCGAAKDGVEYFFQSSR